MTDQDAFAIGDVVRVRDDFVEPSFEKATEKCPALTVVGIFCEGSQPNIGTPAGCEPARPGYVWVFYLRVGYRDSARFAEACYLQLPVVALERVEP